jgi:hypothetical protein
MGIEVTLAVAGLALAAAGTGTQFVAQQKQAKASKRSAKEQEKLNAATAARQRRRAIRESRIARGRALNVGAQVGASESSGLSGGLSGISSQLGSNLGFNLMTEGSQQEISRLGRKQASAASLGAIGGGIAGIGGSLFSGASAFGGGGDPTATPGIDPRRLPGGIGAGR